MFFNRMLAASRIRTTFCACSHYSRSSFATDLSPWNSTFWKIKTYFQTIWRLFLIVE